MNKDKLKKEIKEMKQCGYCKKEMTKINNGQSCICENKDCENFRRVVYGYPDIQIALAEAKLQQRIEDEKEFSEIIDEWWKKITINRLGYENKYFTIDKEDIEELKSKIIGSQTSAFGDNHSLRTSNRSPSGDILADRSSLKTSFSEYPKTDTNNSGDNHNGKKNHTNKKQIH